MADTAATPVQHASGAAAQQHPPPVMRRLSSALRAPFRRNSASSTPATQVGETPTSVNVPEQAVSTSPPRAHEDLPPIQSQENLGSTQAPSISAEHATGGASHASSSRSSAANDQHKPNFLKRIWSHNKEEPPVHDDTQEGLLPTSPTHQRHPSDAHAGKQRYTFISDLNEPSPYDVLGTNDVDAREAAKGPPNAPVRRQSTLQADPVFRAEGDLSRTRSPSHSGLSSLDTGDYVQDHVLEGLARMGHPFHKSRREPWEQSPEASAKEHQLHQDNHLQQMIESEQAEGQEKAKRLARQETEREQHKSSHEQATTVFEPEKPGVSRSKTTDPSALAHVCRGSSSAQPLDAKTNTMKRETSPSSPSSRRTSANSPPSPTSPGATDRQGRKFSLGRSNSISQAGSERHSGLIHMLDSRDFVQDKVLGALAFAGGRRRSSAASSSGAIRSPVASPGAKPSEPTQQVPQVPPLPESLDECAEKANAT